MDRRAAAAPDQPARTHPETVGHTAMNVFLSASFPSGKRGKKFKPYDTAAISAAVRALTRAILLAEHRIVFGAHPMISPVVLLAAGEFEVSGAIDVFQSE